MIPRYSLPEMAALFTDEAKFGAWLEVEILATEAWAELGVVPKDAAAAVRARGRFRRRRDRRARAGHRARCRRVRRRGAGAGRSARGRWVHYGLTSSDVVDTALALQLTRAAELLIDAAEALDRAITAGPTSPRHADGRPHARDPRRADHVRREARALGAPGPARRRAAAPARAGSRSGKFSGAVGTYSNVDPFVEQHVCAGSGSTPVPATQVLARDRHAELLYACASPARTVEQCALEIRHLQRTEVREVEEAVPGGKQKGSSAMPHKRNPVKSEQLCGLARVLRGDLRPASRTWRCGTSATSPTPRSSG